MLMCKSNDSVQVQGGSGRTLREKGSYQTIIGLLKPHQISTLIKFLKKIDGSVIENSFNKHMGNKLKQ